MCNTLSNIIPIVNLNHLKIEQRKLKLLFSIDNKMNKEEIKVESP